MMLVVLSFLFIICLIVMLHLCLTKKSS
jgi:hypothetical protein